MTTTLSQDYEALMAHVCDNLEDWTTRLVLADCLEEMGRQSHADCMRWRVANKKRPRGYTPYEGANRKYQWYGQEDSSYDPESDLPRQLSAHLTGGRLVGGTDSRREYLTTREAEEDVLQAWARAIQGGWQLS